MYNKKRIELIVKDWFKLKTGLELSDDTISKMVGEITSLDNEIQRSCLGAVSGSTVCLETADFYQEFFNFFSREHNRILTIQEMDEIRHECRKLEKRRRKYAM